MREGSGVSADPHAFQVVLYSYSKVIMQGGSRGGVARAAHHEGWPYVYFRGTVKARKNFRSKRQSIQKSGK